jgi:hypothetical protein
MLCLLCAAGQGAAFAAEPVPDTAYRLRTVPAEYLETYRADPYYRYTETRQRYDGWWERWIDRLLRKLFSSSNRTAADLLDFCLKLAAVVLLLIALYLLVKNGVVSPFGRKARKLGEIQPESIDFSDADAYPRLLGEALAQNDYIQAVRIRFLYLLKQMDERGIIRQDHRKTNADYGAEIRRKELRRDFRELAWYFECVCYGDFRVEPETYRYIEQGFNRFQEVLKG